MPGSTILFGARAVSLGPTSVIGYTSGQLIAFHRSSGYGQNAGYGYRYVFRDHLGYTSTIIDGKGEKLWEYRFLPFGDVRYTYHRDNDPTFPVQTDCARVPLGHRPALGCWRWRICHRQRPGPGPVLLQFTLLRDSSLGRFLQPDTIVPEPGNPQSLNRYTYVNNNPLRYTDPSGHHNDPGGTNPLGGGGKLLYLIVSFTEWIGPKVQQGIQTTQRYGQRIVGWGFRFLQRNPK